MLVSKRILQGIYDESRDLGNVIPSSTGLTGLTYSESKELDIVKKGQEAEYKENGETFNISRTKILTIKAIIEATEVLNNEKEESLY